MDALDSSPGASLRRTLVRRWPVLLLVTVVAVAAAAVAGGSRSARYTSSGQLLIVPLAQYDQTYFGSGMFRDSGDATLTAPTAAAVLDSDDVARAAAAKLADGISAATVLADVQVTATTDTNVLRVVASADRRARAIRLATAFVNAVISTRARVVKADIERRIAVLDTRPEAAGSQLAALRLALRAGTDPTVEVAQLPVRAKAVSSVSIAAIVALGLVGGAFLGLLLAFGLDLLSAAVLDEADASRRLRVLTWGRVPRLSRAARRRAGPIAPSLLSPQARAEYEQIAAQIARREPAGAVYALVSPSAGDGRTTTAAAICAALAARGLPSALVAVGTPPGRQLSAELSAAGVELASGADDVVRPLSEVLEHARRRAAVVVIDGGPLERAGDIALLARLAQLIVVVRIGHTPTQLIAQARLLFEQLGCTPIGAVVVADAPPPRTRSRGAYASDSSRG